MTHTLEQGVRETVRDTADTGVAEALGATLETTIELVAQDQAQEGEARF
jgi:hypothetical protein